MKRLIDSLLAAVAFLALAGMALAQDRYALASELKIVGPGVKVVTVVESVPFSIEAPKGGTGYVWQYPPNVTANRKKSVLEITAAPKGSLTVSVDWSTAKIVNGTIEFTDHSASITFAVGEVVPPKPVDPVDKPPFPAEQFTVLIVHETADKLPSAQKAIITSVLVREYLAKKCPNLSDGQTAYRIWDWNTDPAADLPVFQEAWKAKTTREKIPWILISDGKKGFSGPLPATVTETLNLLRKYGGE